MAGDNIEIMDRVQKLLRVAHAHENFLKTELGINKSMKESSFYLEVRKVNRLYYERPGLLKETNIRKIINCI